MASHPGNYNFLFHSVVSFPDNTEHACWRPEAQVPIHLIVPNVSTTLTGRDRCSTDTCEKRHGEQTMPDSPFSCMSSVMNPLLGITSYFSNRSELKVKAGK